LLVFIGLLRKRLTRRELTSRSRQRPCFPTYQLGGARWPRHGSDAEIVLAPGSRVTGAAASRRLSVLRAAGFD
jgi:hypothetical protein